MNPSACDHFLLLSALNDEDPLIREMGPHESVALARLAHQLHLAGISTVTDPRRKWGPILDAEQRRGLLIQYILETRSKILAVGIQLPFSESVGANRGASDTDYSNLDGVITTIREQGLPLILGGNGITLDGVGTMSRMRDRIGPRFDGTVGVSGEADSILPELLRADPNTWQADRRLFKTQNGKVTPGIMQLLSKEELAALPPLEHTDEHPFNGIEAAGRGCKSNCTFCAIPGLSGGPSKMRAFQPKQFVDQVRLLMESGRSGIGTTDADLLDNGMDFWRAVAAIIEEEGLGGDFGAFHLCGYTNAFRLKLGGGISEEDLRLLRGVGLRTVGFGVQSTVGNVLRSVHRPPVSLPAIRQFIGRCRNLGMAVDADMIFGLPGQGESESNEDLAAMLAMTMWGALPSKVFFYAHRPGSATHKEAAPPPPSERTYTLAGCVRELMDLVHLLNVFGRDAEQVKKDFPIYTPYTLLDPGRIETLACNLEIVLGDFQNSGWVSASEIQKLKAQVELMKNPSYVKSRVEDILDINAAALAEHEGKVSPRVFAALSDQNDRHSRVRRADLAAYLKRVAA